MNIETSPKIAPQVAMTPCYELNRILPKPMFDHTTFKWLGYRNYPVFGWAWFWRRSILVAIVAAVFSVLVALVVNVTEPKQSAALNGLHIWLAFAGTATVPVFLATLVRQRFDRRRWLVLALAAAISLGGLAQYSANMWMNNVFPKSSSFETGKPLADKVAADKKAIEESPVAQFADFALLAAFYLAVGGAFAVLRYPSELRQWNVGLKNFELGNAENLRRASDQKLSVLQAQIEPHFLFNTLASIRSLVRREPQRAEDSIDALVDYLRLTLPKFRDGVNAHQSTLKEQFELCESYLQLMKIRMGERLSYELNLPFGVRSYRFPSLILITLVENAIKHGLEPKITAGHVVITAIVEREALNVSVMDNGVGLQSGAAQETKPGAGVGLSNIRAQLAERYQGRATLVIGARPNAGFTASISIPIDLI